MTEQATDGQSKSGQRIEQRQSKPQQQSSHESFPYKNRLLDFARRAKISLPVYHTINEGPVHARKFRSSVEVDGNTYTCVNAFSCKKAAEQYAAKVALEAISKKLNNWVVNKMNAEGFPPIYEEKVICKSILHEFAAKMNLEKPKYDTVWVEGALPGFQSCVDFGGAKYSGEPCKTKKEAEQCAAREAILSILGNLGLGTILPEIVKSKAKRFSTVYEQSCSDVGVGAPPEGLDLGKNTAVSKTTGLSVVDAKKTDNLTKDAAREVSEGPVSDVNSLQAQPCSAGLDLSKNISVSETRGVAARDGDANKTGNLRGDASPEACEGRVSNVHSLQAQLNIEGLDSGNSTTVSETREVASGNEDANKTPSLTGDVVPEALEGQVSDVHSPQAQPNIGLSNCNQKRKSRRKKKNANKKLKTELPLF